MKQERVIVPQGDWVVPDVLRRKEKIKKIHSDLHDPERLALVMLEDELSIIEGNKNRRDFSDLAANLGKYIRCSPVQRDFLMIPVFETAVKNNWMRRFEKATRSKINWDSRNWMGHWYDAAINVSLESNILCFHHNRLWRWIERGRFDHNLLPLVPVMEKYGQNGQLFRELVTKRFEIARQTGKVILGEQFELL